ncbi:ribonuclease III domain-containing protein [Thermotoga sp. Ku-13t]|uniref:Mini-ribonuclease 3 n=1 Tax=Thermotoga sp. Ku-13t TaxID=1755813 RepID=UPI001F49F7E3|nr:ribonuclease III domain-containing protein [Thermotoga sp. Ku-13t]
MNWLLESTHPPDRIDPASLPIATLAYVGDAVQSFFAKIKFLSDLNVTQIHKKVARLVSRESQARCLEQILSQLSERELSVVKRALNSKCAKRHGNDADYRKSTALEALIGYLYLIGDRQKLMEILSESLKE